MILNVEQPTLNVPRDVLTKLLNGVDALLKGLKSRPSTWERRAFVVCMKEAIISEEKLRT